jgi:DNA topoisomerase-1
MSKYLIIVESLAKAKTIEKYLGKDYQVKSCYGHVRDLHRKRLSVDIENGFVPTYEIPPDKKDVIAELKMAAADSVHVWLATDEDREGEAISWHLKVALKLEDKHTSRITFNEITKPAILEAMKKPRKINEDLVNAQQARRVLDRLVGFELSPLLWKKVMPALSAGRVQSVATRMVVDRERDIENFKRESSFRIVGEFTTSEDKTVSAELPTRAEDEAAAHDFLDTCRGACFSVKSIETKPGQKSPSPPFTTSTLQQEASRRLGFSVSQTMTVAQKLYEEGKITYMRTDSVNLSATALEGTKELIITRFGDIYSKPRQYKTRTKGAQEAHEAIRPTDPSQSVFDGDRSMVRLYDLIWKRTITSQMANARLEKTSARIGISTREEEFIARGEVVTFDGFLKVYEVSIDDEQQEGAKGLLPAMTVDESLALQHMTARQRFTQPPPRYTEASLVKNMEEQGIGRPATYAQTIATIQKREYVTKEDRPGYERNYRVLTLGSDDISSATEVEITGAEKAKLFPTDIGEVVNDFLAEQFNRIMDYGFTASVEEEFDEIALGRLAWPVMMAKFYYPFHESIITTTEQAKKATGERLLGVDPASGLPVFARLGRRGPMVQIGEYNTENKPRFSSLQDGQSIRTISLDQALELFKLPRDLGVYNEGPVSVGSGRYGPYVRYGEKYLSIDIEIDDPLEIDLVRAIALITEDQKKRDERLIKTFLENPSVQVLNGKFGPYISIDGKNVRIPKDRSPISLTLDECLDLATKSKPGRSQRRSRRHR